MTIKQLLGITEFLYIDPLKQGLKQTGDNQSNGNQ